MAAFNTLPLSSTDRTAIRNIFHDSPENIQNNMNQIMVCYHKHITADSRHSNEWSNSFKEAIIREFKHFQKNQPDFDTRNLHLSAIKSVAKEVLGTKIVGGKQSPIPSVFINLGSGSSSSSQAATTPSPLQKSLSTIKKTLQLRTRQIESGTDHAATDYEIKSFLKMGLRILNPSSTSQMKLQVSDFLATNIDNEDPFLQELLSLMWDPEKLVKQFDSSFPTLDASSVYLVPEMERTLRVLKLLGVEGVEGRKTALQEKLLKVFIDRVREARSQVEKSDEPSTEWSLHLENIFKDLVLIMLEKNGFQIDSTKDSQYALCFAGSIAKKQATPYSDLDCYIIVASEEDVDLFRKAMHEMYYFCDNIAEETNQFFLDPVGINPHFLCGTPEQIIEKLHEMENPILYNSIFSSRALFGNELYDTLVDKLEQTSSKRSADYYYRQVVDDFSGPRTKDRIHIKSDILRPIEFLLSGLREEYGLYESDGSHLSVNKLLDLLVKNHSISPLVSHIIRSVYQEAFAIRIGQHLKESKESDDCKIEHYPHLRELLDKVAIIRALVANHLESEKRKCLDFSSLVTLDYRDRSFEKIDMQFDLQRTIIECAKWLDAKGEEELAIHHYQLATFFESVKMLRHSLKKLMFLGKEGPFTSEFVELLSKIVHNSNTFLENHDKDVIIGLLDTVNALIEVVQNPEIETIHTYLGYLKKLKLEDDPIVETLSKIGLMASSECYQRSMSSLSAEASSLEALNETQKLANIFLEKIHEHKKNIPDISADELLWLSKQASEALKLLRKGCSVEEFTLFAGHFL